MQRTLVLKVITVLVLTLLICIPLKMIDSTISERIEFHQQAVRSIAENSVREQTILGPILVIPYTDEYEEEQVLDGKGTTKIIKQSISRRTFVFPNTLQAKGVIDTDQRYRGIHKVLIYSGQHSLSGDFVLPAIDSFQKEKPNSRITIGKPFIAVSIDDVRGIRNIPTLTWDGKQSEFEQGSELASLKNGLHALVDINDFNTPRTARFSFDIGLDGIERFHFVPIARNNQVSLQSKWPHPQFGGSFLPSPKARKIDENGFSARWAISSLATNAQQQLLRIEQSAAERNPSSVASGANIDYFSVGFIEPVNIYSQADRAIKYGLLFVALTFAGFFLFELLKQLPIHPVQYVLVGLALALFFLLLVSLSEHIDFLYAYLIAGSACVLLIGFYLTYALRNWKRGMGFGTALTVLYGVLFGLLQSENNALVMGSILLFALLTAIMIFTRKVDWYHIGKSNPITT